MWLKRARKWYRIWFFFYGFFTSIRKKILVGSIFRQLHLQNCKQKKDRLSWWKPFWLVDIINTVLKQKEHKWKNMQRMHDLELLVFFIMDLNFKIMYTMVFIISQCCVFIQAILLLSLLKMSIMEVLFIALANLKQLIY